MKNSLRSLFLFLVLSVPAIASAQESAAPRILTWQDCVRTALLMNPDLASSKADLDSAESQYKASWNAFFPQISLNHSFSRSGGEKLSPSNSWSAGIGAQENLLNLRSAAQIRLRKASWEGAESSLRQASAGARYDLLTAFLDLLFAQENVRAAESISDLRAKNARMVALQYEGGGESKGNRMRADALAFQAQVALNQAKRAVGTARRELAQRMGLETYEVFAVTGTFAGRLPDGTTDIELEAEKTPGVSVSRAAVLSSEEQLAMTRADRYPTLSASQSLSWRGKTEFPSDRSWSLGLSLSLPLFASGPTYSYYNVRSASRQTDKARQQLKATRLQARSDLDNAWAQLWTSAESTDANIKLYDAALQRHHEAEVQYVTGRMIFENWESVEQDLVNLESSRLRSARDAATAWAAWERLRGMPLGE